MHASTEVPSRPMQRRIAERSTEQEDGEEYRGRIGAAVIVAILFWIGAIIVLCITYPRIIAWAFALVLIAIGVFRCLRAASR